MMNLTAQTPAPTTPAVIGLTSIEAEERLAELGPNMLPEPEPPSPLRVFLIQFRNPIIYILLLASALSFATGRIEDGLFILVVLLINASIGTYQEYSADRAAAALRRLEQPSARVIRDGVACRIEAKRLVVGDLVLLESGDRIPADLMLVDASDLRCDESLLTGESMPVPKGRTVEGSSDETASSMLRAGSLVTRGRAKGVVTATGTATMLGGIAAELGRASSSQPPLVARLAKFTNALAVFVGLAALVLVVAGFMRGLPLHDLVMMSVGLAVSAVPEGLPIAISVALAVSMRRMAARNVIVRSMPAVEALGSTTIIATDKTGTLTSNVQTVTEIRLPDGTDIALDAHSDLDKCEIRASGLDSDLVRERARRLLRAALLANEGTLARRDDLWVAAGDTVDVALLAAGRKAGLGQEELNDRYPLAARIAYEPEHKYAASFHHGSDRIHVFVKGASEVLIEMSDRMDSAGSVVEIDRASLLAQKEEMAARGLRVLAFAEGEIGASLAGSLGHGHLVDLVFLGLAGLQDPVRPEVPNAMKDCHAAGVEVVMVTGDDPRTAAAIARDAGLSFHAGQVVSGHNIDEAARAGDQRLDEITREARIYARVQPAQKSAIVASLIRNGHIVAVTGDGVNDGPALKKAHVGVAMGLRGTEVAKESADLVVTDDNFASIVAGIAEGRAAYRNIRKVVLMSVATGAAEVLLFMLALPFGLPMPLLPVQLLWLNLVTNGIQDVALAGGRPEGDELAGPPRSPLEPVLDRTMIRRVVQSTVAIGGAAFLAFQWMIAHGYGVPEARNITLLIFVMFENVQTLACSSERRSIFSVDILRNRFLLLSVLAAQTIHISAMYVPWLSGTLGLSPITPLEWGLSMLIASSLVLVTEVDKFVSRRRRDRSSHA
ncbi:cation-translocating P-type ATPase [Rhizobium brockwellii]|jgi:Ca2+-transporting ATPase|uniref:HAD-IC family P-type ATPase n=2 Tax=Rhizobium TaxID=379 RepID=A0ABU3YER2_9HYPH|nr:MULTISPECIES: HAD-IC family P-type ATPase [Rhizobium]MDV4177347.1 HAD-IC family P-type ATPase [Rhizobium brockwellii]MDV4184346.1 HAD-IC family P-type ATPase [Rhizobium brockwellii]NZD53070.1 HAD-IC family P-type ATPase [Rhizobium leguminosarum]QIO50878.1 HAD-IC family P-type ATPase [Rhizobium leguminosarum bv. trifolii]TAV74679.1 HAD family hydrolase [Rhizobium leguminosarum]